MHMRQVAFAPKGKTIAAVSYDAKVRLWDAGTGSLLHRIDLAGSENVTLAFHPDGGTLAITSNAAVLLFAVATGKERKPCEGHRAAIRSVACSPDGKSIATASEDGTLRLWEARTGKPMAQLEMGWTELPRVVFSPDGKRFAASGYCGLQIGILHCWTVGELAKPLWSVENQEHREHIIFSPNGALLASRSRQGPVQILDSATGEASPWLPQGAISAASDSLLPTQVLSPDGRLRATAESGCLHVWERHTDREVLQFQSDDFRIECLAFAPDSRTLVSGGSGAAALVWDLAPSRKGDGQSPEQLWDLLAGTDATAAHRAIWSLASEKGVALLREKLPHMPDLSPDEIRQLIEDFDGPRFAQREAASQHLRQLGRRARPALSEALEKQPTLELRRRVEKLLALLEARETGLPVGEELQQLRAVWALELAGTKKSRLVLGAVTLGPVTPRVVEEVRAALHRGR